MIRASNEIEDENLPIFYNTELNKIMEKHAPEKSKIITLRPEPEMDDRRVKELEEKSKINRKKNIKQVRSQKSNKSL